MTFENAFKSPIIFSISICPNAFKNIFFLSYHIFQFITSLYNYSHNKDAILVKFRYISLEKLFSYF